MVDGLQARCRRSGSSGGAFGQERGGRSPRRWAASLAGGRRAGPGYLAVAGAAVLWAVGGTVARRLIDAGASAVELTEARAWVAAAGVGALLAARRWEPPPRRAAPWPLVVVFGLSIAAANATYYLAIERLPVAVAIVIQYTAPGLVVLWSAVAQRRRPSGRVLWALGLAFAGVVLLAGLRGAGGGGLSGTGVGIAVVSAFAFASYMLAGERVGRALGPVRSVFYGFVVASAFWGILQGARGRPDTLLQPSFLPGVLFLAVCTTIVPFLLFLWGLGRVEASRAGIVSTLEPLTAAVIAYLWLGQSLTASQVAGAVMVVAGIAVVQSERPAPPEVLAERAVLD